ncbi:MAG TPA: hypothetical protein VGN72_16395 [Tepidisphaeraceae bacterium]|jgi:hypothetical protein|nr:hypothetical protein [Tepidisphaeraceae bacterium]
MTEAELTDELQREPFTPFRLHLVSGKTLDVLGATAAHTLKNALLVLRNPVLGSPRADGYDLVAYQNIERIEQLELGGRTSAKRKRA